MPHILFIEGSPRKQRSASIEVATAALEAWRSIDKSTTVDTLDVWSTDLPDFDAPAMEAKYAGLEGKPLTETQALAWSRIEKLTQRFHAADILLIAAPLWNFSVPYKLKQLIDVVSQKDFLFTFDERGLNGLLNGKSALLISARGLDYSLNSATPAERYDFQRPYLEAWLRFIGISETTTILVEKTLFGPDTDGAAREAAKIQARAAAAELADLATRVPPQAPGR